MTSNSSTNSLFHNQYFPVLPFRRDTMGLLANSNLTFNDRTELEMQYFAEGRHVESARLLWKGLQNTPVVDLSATSPIRLQYLLVELDGLQSHWDSGDYSTNHSQILKLLMEETMRVARRSLVSMIRIFNLIEISASNSDPSIQEFGMKLLESVTESESSAAFAKMAGIATKYRSSKSVSPEVKERARKLLSSLRAQAPESGVIAVQQALGEAPGSETWKGAMAVIQSARRLEIEPLIQLVMRANEAGREGDVDELIRIGDRLFGGLVNHLADAAYLAAKENRNEEARRIFEKAGAKAKTNGEREGLRRMEGWSLLLAGEPAAALNSFLLAKEFDGDDFIYSPDLLAGLAIAYHGAGQVDEAVKHYRLLIVIDGKWALKKTIDELGWPEIETTPMELVRVATLMKHPDLLVPEDR